MKTKQCGICLKDFPSLWKAKRKLPDGTVSPGMCKDCASKSGTGKSQFNISVPVKEMFPVYKDILNVVNKPLQSTKTIKPISPISNKRKEALKRYRRLRDKYFLDHPVCEFPDCSSTNITLHHQRGRIGAFLTDKRYFKSLCGKHHRWVEENPTEAIKIGLSIKRLDKHK